MFTVGFFFCVCVLATVLQLSFVESFILGDRLKDVFIQKCPLD